MTETNERELILKFIRNEFKGSYFDGLPPDEGYMSVIEFLELALCKVKMGRHIPVQGMEPIREEWRVHRLESGWGDSGRSHRTDDGECWCKPTILKDAAGGGDIIMHNDAGDAEKGKGEA